MNARQHRPSEQKRTDRHTVRTGNDTWRLASPLPARRLLCLAVSSALSPFFSSSLGSNQARATGNGLEMTTASNHGVWHRIITFAVLFQCTIAWIQRGVRFERQHCSPLATLQRATWCSTAHQGARRGQGTVLFAQDEDSLDLYRTVAEQDPEWYREFVINVLGGDLPEISQSIDKPPQSTKPEETKRKEDNCTHATFKSFIGNQSEQVASPIQGAHDNETVATEDLLTIDESDGLAGTRSTSQPPSDSSEPQQQSTDIFRGPKVDTVMPPNDVVVTSEPSGIIRPINEPGTREKGARRRSEET